MLKQYLIDNYTHDELADVARHGCSGGFGDFIYYCDTIRHFEQFKDDCFECLAEYREVAGDHANINMEDYTRFANSMIWFAVEWYANEITQGEYIKETV
jgi:hypothetical protein